jgi:F-type H+-transporting ATPase subunit b
MNQFVHWNQLLAHALSFVVFYFLVRMAFAAIIYPPMKERRDKIKAEFERIESEKAAAERLRQEYEGHIKRIEAESRERIQNAVTEGQRVAAEIREIARKEAQDLMKRATDEIARERDKAQVALRDEVVQLAMEIAGKVVREELTPEKHRKLVDGFLAEVEQAR